MSRTILVTGAAGFVGRHLLALLGQADARLVGWRRPGVPGWSEDRGAPASIAWRDVDVLDRGSVEDAVADDRPDEVYHLAGAAHVGQSWERTAETLAINVIGTHRLLDALRRVAPGARVLIPSSAMVYRQSADPIREDDPVAPASPYAVSKLAQEMIGLHAWHDDRVAVVVARAFNHVGPGQTPDFFASSFARQLARIEAGRAEPVVHVGNLDARRDLTDVRDTVKAYGAMMKAGAAGRTYNVCSGRAWRIGDILDGLIALGRMPVTVVVDPARLRPSDNPVVLGDAGRLRQETGWAPEIPLERTLQDLFDDWRRRVASPEDAGAMSAARSVEERRPGQRPGAAG